MERRSKESTIIVAATRVWRMMCVVVSRITFGSLGESGARHHGTILGRGTGLAFLETVRDEDSTCSYTHMSDKVADTTIGVVHVSSALLL